VATKYWHPQNIGVYKILAPTEIIGVAKFSRRQNSCVDKIPASKKFSRRQNAYFDKNLASTKILRRQKSHVDRNPASTKCWQRCRRIPLLFGSAESTTAEFSQTSLKISFISQMVHAVAKCGVASGRPAFMGGLSPALYRPAMQKTSQILAPTKYRRAFKIH
jgi:hypothetical protein